MFIRDTTVAPQQEYYADSLLQKPGALHSVFNNLAAGFATPVVGAQMIAGTLDQNPNKEALLNTIQTTELENETPNTSWTSWGINGLSNMIGMGLNPITWLGGGGGGLVSKGVIGTAEKLAPTAATVFARKPIAELLSEPLAKYVPKAFGKEGVPLSLGLIGEKSLETFGTFAGATIPQAAYDNYNQDTKHINWGGVARESGTMGAMGIAIGTIPFAFGVLRGKVNRGLGEEGNSAITPDKLQAALDKGDITKQEHDWYNDYLTHSANPKENPEQTAKLTERATKILTQNDYSPDTVNHEVQFDLLKDTDIESLKGAAADQLVADVPQSQKSVLSDFIVNSRMDELLSDPTKLDGIRGYVDFINNKLASKSEKLAEADRLVDRHLGSNMKESMPLSQKELLKTMKKSGFESKNADRLPIVVPNNVKSSLKKLNKIDELKKRLASNARKVKNGATDLNETVTNLQGRITKLEGEMPKILSPKEELHDIRSKLLSKDGLAKGWERSKEYHRLLDLTNTWKNAKTLAQRVHLEHEYNKQEAFKDLAEHVTNLSDSNLPRLAKISDPLNYLKHRLERNIFRKEPIRNADRVVEAERKIPSDADEVLKQQQETSRKSSAEKASIDFTEASDRYNEFKDKEGVFKNLLACVKGALNG